MDWVNRGGHTLARTGPPSRVASLQDTVASLSGRDIRPVPLRPLQRRHHHRPTQPVQPSPRTAASLRA